MTLLISSDDGWMYIMLAADGGRIAQLCRHPFEHLDDIAFGILFRGGWADHVQQMGRCNGAALSAKIFSCKVTTGDRAQVFVDIGRGQAANVTVFINGLT